MTRPIKAQVTLSALARNLAIVRKFSPGAQIMAVIKANAYGHGLIQAASALASADGFALLEVEDALKLRKEGFGQKILLLEGFFSESELQPIAANDVSVVIHCAEQIRMLDSCPGRLDIFLKLNTGMNRLGFSAEEFLSVVEILEKHPKTASLTLMTHFACADEPAGISSQLELFEKHSPKKFRRTLANSAAILRFPETHADWVRPGIMLYGASPFAEVSACEIGLAPAMTLSSEIIAIQQVKKGQAVGYGGMYVAEKDLRIGIVACGYADGYPRHAPTGTPILVNGVKTRTLGRVSMDMLYADLASIEDARVGTPVVLWGKGLPVEEVAASSGTISYELLCALAPRVPIFYD